MSTVKRRIPIGIAIIRKCKSICSKKEKYDTLKIMKNVVLLLSYIAYINYHMTRRPISVVKGILHKPDNPEDSYEPFQDPATAKNLFGIIDSSFLFTYAFVMFLAGYIAERSSIRLFLFIGMAGAGLSCCLFGLAKYWGMHSIWYFLAVQITAGVFHTTGWPSVVTLIGRWFTGKNRGFIFGIWNSHTSVGNISGLLLGAAFAEKDWALSFIVPGSIMIFCSILMLLFLVDSPGDLALMIYDEDEISGSDEKPNASEQTAIGFCEALFIPGVLEFAWCLFFAKLVSYTFIFWLPFYILNTTTFGPSISAFLAVLFDIGGIVGAVIAGIICDATGLSATICSVMLAFGIPLLILYLLFGSLSVWVAFGLLFVLGMMVNGPYALIMTFVSADLGQHPSLGSNSAAIATVTAIINGTGSIGAAVGPIVAGFLSSKFGWNVVFYFLVVCNFIAMLLLIRLEVSELSKIKRVDKKHRRQSSIMPH